MARVSAGIRMAVACTVISASLLAAGPARADLGDPIAGVVGGAGGGAVQDTVGDAVEGTVGQVTDSSDAVLKDTVQKVTKRAGSSLHEASSGARDDVTKLSQPAAEPQPGNPPALGSKPQEDLATPTADTSDALSNAPPQRPKAHSGQPARERASAVGAPRTSAHGDTMHRSGDSMHRLLVAKRGARPMAAALAPQVDNPCESESLAVRDLRHCARAGTPLPGLGGVPMILLQGGLLMVGAGLILVACGRLRRTCVAPAT